MTWKLASSRPVHWPRVLLGPRPKIPAWRYMPAAWKPLSMKTGRAGRHFSRRTRATAACTRAALRGHLGAVGQGDRDQVIEQPAGLDQRDLQVVVLQRDDHRARVEPEGLRQVGAGDAPLLPREDGALLEVGDHVPCPIDLDARDQVAAQLRDALDQVVTPLDGVQGAGVHPAVLVHAEVGVGGRHQDVVLGGLDVEVAAVEDLSGGQGLEDDVGQVDHLPQAGAAVEEVGAVRPS